ncbi:MAG: hypothetical protein PHV99_02440 [Candidatus Pacebacteria bacterium]|nr:hypothetical protein [Candidatus Paceibacterota bacterium]
MSESVTDIVHVDRSVPPVYPGLVRDVLHPELELTGPADYLLNNLTRYRYGAQKTYGQELGTTIYKHLKETNRLPSCLGLADLQTIQKFDLDVFRRYFAGEEVPGWKSAVRDLNGNRVVPYLIERHVGVVLEWGWFGGRWGSNGPAFRFALYVRASSSKTLLAL